jgi:hypothetical protein
LWKIPKTAPGDYDLLFLDSEGTGNATGVDQNLPKALAVLSCIATIRITVDANQVGEEAMREMETALKLQCLRSKRDSAAETSSALVLMSRDVGIEGDPPTSLQEMEERRRDQDRDTFHTVIRHFPKHGFTPENFLVLLQPQWYDDSRDVQSYMRESYMESMRDLVRFIDAVCRTKRSDRKSVV